MAKSKLRLVSPTHENRTVVPRRRPNAELRTREHLTEREVERLIEAAKANRHGHRDSTMVLLAYRHGLRASELCDLRWDQMDFNRAVLHVRRVKQGTPATHPLTGLEMRALRKLQRESEASPFVFVSERGAPFSTGRLCQDAGTSRRDGTARNQGASTHAAPCLRFQARHRPSPGCKRGVASLGRLGRHCTRCCQCSNQRAYRNNLV
jgi:integrase